ncbi:MAG: hypothetical protein ACK4M5_12405 [Dietzia cercidiphylli]
MTTGTDVLAFLGHDSSDTEFVAQADAAVRTVTAMVGAYCRGRHLHPTETLLVGGEFVPVRRDGVDDVILTAAARLLANPEQLAYDIGDVSIRGGFSGFTLVELAVLNRYRVRAL